MSAPDTAAGRPPGAPVNWHEAVATLLADPGQHTLARDCYFDGTVLEAGQRYWASEEWQAARTLLPRPAGSALDLGAGRGIASYALARDGWRVCALEPDPSGLVGAGAIRSLAAVTGYPIEVFEAFGERLPFAAGRFDLVLARQSLHHAHDLRQLVGELFRVTRPGGRLVALRDHVISRAADLVRFEELHPLHRLYGGERAYELREYVAAISDAGFTLRQVIRPLASPINYAPLTRATLPAGLAAQLPDLPGLRRLALQALRSPSVLSLAVKLLSRVDNRPGRLYSFVADRHGV